MTNFAVHYIMADVHDIYIIDTCARMRARRESEHGRVVPVFGAADSSKCFPGSSASVGASALTLL